MGRRPSAACRHYDDPIELDFDRERVQLNAGIGTRVQRALVRHRDRPSADEPLDGPAVAVAVTREREAQQAEGRRLGWARRWTQMAAGRVPGSALADRH